MATFDFDAMRAKVAERNARIAAKHDQALAALDDALRKLAESQMAVGEALLDAVDMGIPEEPIRTKLAVSHATFWRRVNAARQAVGE